MRVPPLPLRDKYKLALCAVLSLFALVDVNAPINVRVSMSIAPGDDDDPDPTVLVPASSSYEVTTFSIMLHPAFKVFRGIGNCVLLLLVSALCARVLLSHGVDVERVFFVKDTAAAKPSLSSSPASGDDEYEYVEGDDEEEDDDQDVEGAGEGVELLRKVSKDAGREGRERCPLSVASPAVEQRGLPPNSCADFYLECVSLGTALSISSLLSFIFYVRSVRSTLALTSMFPSYFPQLFPLFLTLHLFAALLRPLSRFKRGLCILAATVSAPFCPGSFRDGFVGDVLTSTVRPMQDLSFTVLYFLSASRGWLFHPLNFDPHKASAPVESSYILNTVVLPACIVSPLFWRFLQTLRRCYESKQRWPHLGNSLKYFVAAQVSLYALYDPELRKTALWVMCFVGATLYQIWWDVVMDWDLVRLTTISDLPKNGAAGDDPVLFRVGNRVLTLRRARLYQSNRLYVAIFYCNIVLRFFWTLSLIPPKYLASDGTLKNFYSDDLQLWLTPIIAAAEICRRGAWSLLRIELEHLSIHAKAESATRLEQASFEKMKVDSGMASSAADDGVIQGFSNPVECLQSDMSDMRGEQVIVELGFWVFAFVFFGAIGSTR